MICNDIVISWKLMDLHKSHSQRHNINIPVRFRGDFKKKKPSLFKGSFTQTKSTCLFHQSKCVTRRCEHPFSPNQLPFSFILLTFTPRKTICWSVKNVLPLKLRLVLQQIIHSFIKQSAFYFPGAFPLPGVPQGLLPVEDDQQISCTGNI